MEMTTMYKKSESVRGHAAALLTILIWGVTFISTKILLTAFTPIEILFIRFLIGYLALWLVCPRRLVLKGFRQEGWFAASAAEPETAQGAAEAISQGAEVWCL